MLTEVLSFEPGKIFDAGAAWSLSTGGTRTFHALVYKK
jgi:hypothetical protein